MTLVRVQANYPGTDLPIRRGKLLVTILSGPSGVAYRGARYGGTSFYELSEDGYIEVEQISNDDPELERDDTITKFEIPGIITTHLRIPMGGPVSWTDPAIQARPDPPRDWAPIQGPRGVPGAGLPSALSYGAVGDGRDDKAAIQNGLDDLAEKGGGGLLLPTGYDFRWAEDLVVPAGVDLVGPASGKRAFQAKLTALGADARIIVGERGDVNQGGVLRDLAIDGAGVARNPLYIGLAVTRCFERLTVMGSTEQGIVLDGAQNCTFLGVDVLDSAGDAWVFDGGTGGHVLQRIEVGAFAGSGMVFKASYDTTGDGRVYYQPTDIQIFGAILERAFEDGAAYACILAAAADRVKFYDPVFAQSAAVTNGDPDENGLVVVDYDGSNGANLCELHLISPTFNPASLSAAARLEAQSGLFITGHTTFKNCAPVGIVANGGYANLDGHQVWANTPVRYGGSASTDGIADGIFYAHHEAPVRVARPTETQVAYAVHVDGDPFDRLQILASGLIQVGDGTAAPTAQLYLGADGHNIRTNMRLTGADGIVPLVKAGPISDSDFVHSPPNGTLAVDTATPALWFRVGGVWTSVGGDAATTSAIAAAIAAHSAASDPHGDRAFAVAQIAAAVTGVFKDAGPVDCSTNPNYPAASKGDAYVVTVAGKVGGASGITVEVSDVIWATATNGGGTQAAVGASWSVLAHHLVGAVLAANDLSDVASPAAALANLGGVSNTDPRLSDARTPTVHGSSHVTGGADVIPSAVAGGNAGLMTGADKTKLNGVTTAAVSPSGTPSSSVFLRGDGAWAAIAYAQIATAAKSTDGTFAAPNDTSFPTTQAVATALAAMSTADRLYTSDLLATVELELDDKVDSIQGHQGIAIIGSGAVLRTPGGLTGGAGWNAATNTPTLTDGIGIEGDTYYVTVANPAVVFPPNDPSDPSQAFAVGDYVTYAGGHWIRSNEPPVRGLLVETDYRIGADVAGLAWGPHMSPDVRGFGLQAGTAYGPAGITQVTGRVVMAAAATAAVSAGMGVASQSVMFYENDPTVAGAKLTVSWGKIVEGNYNARGAQYVGTRNELDYPAGVVEGGFWSGEVLGSDPGAILDGGLYRSATDGGFMFHAYTANVFMAPGIAARRRVGPFVEDIKGANIVLAAVATRVNVGSAAFTPAAGTPGTGVIAVNHTPSTIAKSTVRKITDGIVTADSDGFGGTIYHLTSATAIFCRDDARHKQVRIGAGQTPNEITTWVSATQVVLKYAATPAAGQTVWIGVPTPKVRSVSDGVVAASTDGLTSTLTSATAAFTSTDLGSVVIINGVANAITAINSGTKVTLAVAATAGTGLPVIIGAQFVTLGTGTAGAVQAGYSKVAYTGTTLTLVGGGALTGWTYDGCLLVLSPPGGVNTWAEVGAHASSSGIFEEQYGVLIDPLANAFANYPFMVGIDKSDYIVAVDASGDLIIRDGAASSHGQVVVKSAATGSAVQVWGDYGTETLARLGLGAGFISFTDGTTALHTLTAPDATYLLTSHGFKVTGTLAALAAATVAGDFSVATNKFTVAAASGNTAVAGTLDVAGALTAAAVNLSGVLASTGGTANVGDGTSTDGQIRLEVGLDSGFASAFLKVFDVAGDAQPMVRVGRLAGSPPGIAFGAGGAALVDANLVRIGVGALRVGGSLTITSTLIAQAAMSLAGIATFAVAPVFTDQAGSRTALALGNVDNTSDATKNAAAATLTNKRVTRRVLATNAPGATPTINTDSYDTVKLTGLNTAITSMTSSLTGTPADGDWLAISFTDNGTARNITFGASFEASGTVALPTATVISTRLDCLFTWNTVTSKWRLVWKA